MNIKSSNLHQHKSV